MKKSAHKSFRILAGLFTAIVLIGIIAVLCMVQGHVVGNEFAPSHFQSRRFEFYELPGLQWQLTPIYRKSNPNDTAIYITQKSLVSVPTGPPTIWHPIDLQRGAKVSPDDAALLTEILSIQRGNESFWKKWSIDHSAAAAVLWPIVQRLAERELYVLIPGVLEIAEQTTDAGELATELDRFERQQYQSMIVDFRAAGDTAIADSLQSELDRDAS